MAITSLTDIAGLEVWARADLDVFTDTAGTTPAGDTDSVKNWGNQATADDWTEETTPPVLDTTGISSLPTLLFSTDKNMSLGTGHTYNAGFTFAYIMRLNSIESSNTRLTGSLAGSTIGLRVLSASNIRAVFDSSATANAVLSTPIPTDGSAALVVFTYNPTSGTFAVRLNGSQVGTASNAGEALTVNKMFGGSLGGLDIDIAELAFYTSELTGTDLTDVEDYLNETYFGSGRPGGGDPEPSPFTPIVSWFM